VGEAAVVRLAAAIEELVRVQAASAPTPRGLPYLGLEHVSGTSHGLLDALAAHGIFRKYERVLDVGAGLGGSSRWLAARLGCEVFGTTAGLAEAAAGAQLTRRAGLATQVRLVPASPERLPVRERHFTHVWMVETLPRCRDPDRALVEAHAALRPGGTFALQDLVRGERGARPPVPGWRCATVSERVAALTSAGFVELVVTDPTAEATERSARLAGARAQLLRRLRRESRGDPGLVALVAEREAAAAALRSGALRVIHIVARRA
jgi:SAM-dependent methyltransferase